MEDGQSELARHDFESTFQLLTRFDYFGRYGDLKDAFEACSREQIGAPSKPMQHEGGESKALHAFALVLQFERDGGLGDSQEAQELCKALTEAPPTESGVQQAALYAFGRAREAEAWDARYQGIGTEEALDSAVDCYRQALSVLRMPSRHAVNLHDLKLHLAQVLLNRTLWGQVRKEDIQEAGELVQDVVQSITSGDILAPFAFHCLSRVFHLRWRQGGRKIADLGESVEASKQAVELSRSHRLRYLFSASLGLSLMLWHNFEYEERKSNSLDEGVALMEEAEGLRSSQNPNDPWLSNLRHNLGTAYLSRFSSLGDLEDITRAVDIFRLSGPRNNCDVCAALCYRYEETGRLEDLDNAIATGQEALDDANASKESPIWALWSLGWAISLRYVRNMRDADFDLAKIHLEDALSRAPQSDHVSPDLWAGCHRTLSQTLMARFRATKDVQYCGEAIQHLREAVTLLPPQHGSLPSYISGLGHCLCLRSDQVSSKHDLNEAILNHQQALRLAPQTYGEHHLLLWRYGHALSSRFKSSHNLEDIGKAIDVLSQLAAWADDTRHPRFSLYRAELARAYALRYETWAQHGDLARSLRHYANATDAEYGFTMDRFDAAMAGATLARVCDDFAEATKLYTSVISLVPRIAWLGHDADLRHEQLASIVGNVAPDAAACAIAAGMPQRAVELLEEGRSFFWQSLLRLRTNVDELQAIAPELAEELRDVGQALEHDDSDSSQPSGKQAEERGRRRRRLAERWETLVEEVRRMRGFESFLKPLPFSILQRGAEEGPIIILNISIVRSDALLITASEPVKAVALPKLHAESVRQLVRMVQQAIPQGKDKRGCKYVERVIIEVLRFLWNNGLNVVAEALGPVCRSPVNDGLQRVWWIPTGVLSLLPIHCAGPYNHGLPGLAENMISSYTTTISALLMARASQVSQPSDPFRMLAVSVPEVKGFDPLPSAHLEMSVLSSVSFSESVSFLDGQFATVDSVTAGLAKNSWLHICCHGSSSPQRPLESTFHLADGRLNLHRIIQLRLTRPDFAFLSACHSARQANALPDEALHLTGALQVAGFRGLIATSWGMADCDGPLLAWHFYRLVAQGGSSPDSRNAAAALHKAIACMRQEGIPIYRWATFVHFGI